VFQKKVFFSTRHFNFWALGAYCPGSVWLAVYSTRYKHNCIILNIWRDQYIYPFTCVIFILDGGLSEVEVEVNKWKPFSSRHLLPAFFSSTPFFGSKNLHLLLSSPLLQQYDGGDINISYWWRSLHSSCLQQDEVRNINKFTVASVKLNRQHQCLRWWGRWTSRSCGRWGRWWGRSPWSTCQYRSPASPRSSPEGPVVALVEMEVVEEQFHEGIHCSLLEADIY